MRFLAALLLGVLSLSAAEPALVPIFNGRDLTGWSSPDREKFWRVENGVLIGESTGDLKENYLWSEKAYGDFVLEFEARWTGEIDSGVEMRSPKIQLQLGVSRSLKRDMTGSLYTGKYPEAAQAKAAATLLRPDGEWNTFRIQVQGATFNGWINGQPSVVNYVDDRFAGAAPLGLQVHGGVKMKVEYRNLRIAELPPAPCVFCEIVAGARQQESIVYRDDLVVAFLSSGQRNPGHVLIVPAVHAQAFPDVPDATMHHMTDVAKKIAAAIKRTDLKMEGYHLQMNTGTAAGQSVFHAHLHLIPRFIGDANGIAILTDERGKTGQAEAAPMTKREPGEGGVSQAALAPIAAKIRAALAEPEAKR